MGCSLSHKLAPDDGYASMLALILCAGLAMMVAASLSLAMQADKLARRQFDQAVRDEALNTALMYASVDTLKSLEPARIQVRYVVRGLSVTVSGENEGLKWPLVAAGSVTAVELSQRGTLDISKARSMASAAISRQQAEGRILTLPADDCFRRLFSPYGQAKPGEPVSTAPRSKQAEVWRFRAIAGGQVREVYMRFVGDTHQVYAVLSEDTFPVLQEPTCAS